MQICWKSSFVLDLSNGTEESYCALIIFCFKPYSFVLYTSYIYTLRALIILN